MCIRDSTRRVYSSRHRYCLCCRGCRQGETFSTISCAAKLPNPLQKSNCISKSETTRSRVEGFGFGFKPLLIDYLYLYMRKKSSHMCSQKVRMFKREKVTALFNFNKLMRGGLQFPFFPGRSRKSIRVGSFKTNDRHP